MSIPTPQQAPKHRWDTSAPRVQAINRGYGRKACAKLRLTLRVSLISHGATCLGFWSQHVGDRTIAASLNASRSTAKGGPGRGGGRVAKSDRTTRECSAEQELGAYRPTGTYQER